MFKKDLSDPIYNYLSDNILSFINVLITINSKEKVMNLLSSYLKNTLNYIKKIDSIYKNVGLINYTQEIIYGKRSIEDCCKEIYNEVFLKIQFEMCDYYNRYNYSATTINLSDVAGNIFTKIIRKS